MGIPKITKQTDLRDNLYKTLEEVANGGVTHLVPTKNGEVIIISRQEYDSILLEKEFLQEFQNPIKFEELTEASEVFKKLDEDTKGFMLKNVELDSETPFEEQITSLEGVFSKMVQVSADTNQYGPGAGQGVPAGAIDEKLVGEIVENM